jgi:hypothetical protein
MNEKTKNIKIKMNIHAQHKLNKNNELNIFNLSKDGRRHFGGRHVSLPCASAPFSTRCSPFPRNRTLCPHMEYGAAGGEQCTHGTTSAEEKGWMRMVCESEPSSYPPLSHHSAQHHTIPPSHTITNQ